MAGRCTWTWSEGEYAGKQCGRPVVQEGRCTGCLAGQVPPRPRSIAPALPALRGPVSAETAAEVKLLHSYCPRHSTVTEDAVLEYLMNHPLPHSRALFRILTAAAERDHVRLAKFILAREELMCSPEDNAVALLGSLLDHHRLDLADLFIAKGPNISEEQLGRLYAGRDVRALEWLIARGPASLMDHETDIRPTVLTTLVEAKAYGLAQQVLAFYDEYPWGNWRRYLKLFPAYALTRSQQYAAPGWLITHHRRQGHPVTTRRTDFAGWCPRSAVPCAWTCPGHCRKSPLAEGRICQPHLEPLLHRLLEGEDCASELSAEDRETLFFYLESKAKDMHHDDPALPPIIRSMLFLAPYDEEEAMAAGLLQATVEQLLRSARPSLEILRVVTQEMELDFSIWWYLAQRFLLPHRRLALGADFIPYGIFGEVSLREAKIRAALGMVLPATLVGYVLRAT